MDGPADIPDRQSVGEYRPDFLDRFGSIEASRQHCQVFFGRYNDKHRHSGLRLHTPTDVHYGTAPA